MDTGYPPRRPPVPDRGQRAPPWITLRRRQSALYDQRI